MVDHAGHGSGGLQFFGLGNPAGEPGFVSAVTDVGEVGTGVFELGHGILAKVAGGVALDAVVAGKEVGGIEGRVRHGESFGRDRDAGEFAAFHPVETEGACARVGRGVGNFNGDFAGVDAEAFGEAIGEGDVFAIDFEGELAFGFDRESEAVALGDVEVAFEGGGEGSGREAGG